MKTYAPCDVGAAVVRDVLTLGRGAAEGIGPKAALSRVHEPTTNNPQLSTDYRPPTTDYRLPAAESLPHSTIAQGGL